MEVVPIRQVKFPGTRTSRSKFPNIPPKFAPIRPPARPSMGYGSCGAYCRYGTQTPSPRLSRTPAEPNYPT
eukprot:395380-Prymnesium_polylepis.1